MKQQLQTTHLCLMLRIHFLLGKQIQVGRHDEVKSLVISHYRSTEVW